MRRMAITLVLGLMIPMTACDRSPTAQEEPAVIAGTYDLKLVNHNVLPFIVAQSPSGEDRVEVVSGYLKLEANGRFEDELVLRFTEDGHVEDETDAVSGIWVANGNTLTLTQDTGVRYTVVVRGDTLSQVINGFVLHYVRR
jgi:hypothetical protein